MLGDSIEDVGSRLAVADFRAMAQRHIANIGIKLMLLRIAIPIGFIGTYRVLIPLAGKNALTTNRFKPTADPTNSSKEIHKTERIMRMMRRRLWQHRRQVGTLIFT